MEEGGRKRKQGGRRRDLGEGWRKEGKKEGESLS